MMDLINEAPPDSDESKCEQFFKPLQIRYQSAIDKLSPYTKTRWLITLTLLSVYILRIYFVQGFHIISYALAIYILDEAPTLPRTEADEFRPFIPRLLEAKFWHRATRAIFISIVCTFFSFLDVPVFWPILVIYFILLFTVMMKRQIKHMITHRYMPFSYGKPHPTTKVIDT
nr:protein rer1 [Hymenolepis microstoma]